MFSMNPILDYDILGAGCDEDDKYLDPEAYYDPYWCDVCDQFFTNTGAFKLHRLFHAHARRSVGGRGRVRGGGLGRGGSSGGDGGFGGGGGGRFGGGGRRGRGGQSMGQKKGYSQRNAAFFDESSSDEDSLDDKTQMMAMLYMSFLGIVSPSTEPEMDRLRSYSFMGDNQSYSCGKCNKSCTNRGEYWFHLTKIHRECAACKRKFKTDKLIDEHYRGSPCLGWPVGMSGGDGQWFGMSGVGGDESGGISGVSAESGVTIEELLGCSPSAVKVRSAPVVLEPVSCGKDISGNNITPKNVVSPCPICDDIPPSVSALYHHMSRIHHKCLLCKIQFESKEDLLDHFSMSKQHKFCLTCSLEFPCREELEGHQKTHHPDVLLTTSKGKGASSDDTSIPNGVAYRCEFCIKDVKTFSSVDELQFHLLRQHIRCFPCRREFAAEESLSTHLKMYSGHNFCHLCDSDFVSASALSRHSSICGSGPQLGLAPNVVPPEAEKREAEGIRACETEEVLNTVKEVGKIKLNCCRDPAMETVDSDISEGETDDEDEQDFEDSDLAPVVEEGQLPFVSRDAAADPPGTLLETAKEAPVSVSSELNPQEINVSTAVRQAPAAVSGETPNSLQRVLSGTCVPDDRFACSTCGVNSGSCIALNQHYATIHNKCLRCRIQFESQEDLQCHSSNSKVHVQKFCGKCKMGFFSEKDLSAHTAVTHSGKAVILSGGLIFCNACGNSPVFHTEEELEAHLQFDHLRCFPCKREFHIMKSLVDHMAQSSKHYYCAGCETNFLCSRALSVHSCPGLPFKVTRAIPAKVSAPKASVRTGGTTEDW